MTGPIIERLDGPGVPDDIKGQPWIGADGVVYADVAPYMREIAAVYSKWVEDQRLVPGGADRGGGMFDRNAYVPPENVFEQMRIARRAVENDDVVGEVADVTEGLAVNDVHFEAEERDDAEVFNQWAAVVDLDSYVRTAWRSLLSDSQVVTAAWWGYRTFKLRGRVAPPRDDDGIVELEKGLPKQGEKRKRTVADVYCPLALTTLDSTKVIPVGNLMFGMEQLAWSATEAEVRAFRQFEDDGIGDALIARLFVGVYRPGSDEERRRLVKMGVNPDALLLLNPGMVWRKTLTRPHHQPWADVRLKRTFRWLDLKQQLMSSDRVSLIGNANYILLIKKGTDDHPADQTEVDALNASYQHIAKLPVMIGDHRLSIEIVTPKLDMTLNPERYDAIDARLFSTTLMALVAPGRSANGDRAGSMGKAIARGLQNRRKLIRRDIESNIARRIVEHPVNEGKFKGNEPNLVFGPRNLNLESDSGALSSIQFLLARGDLSRRTALEEAGDFDMDTEAQRRTEEREHYDHIFQSSTPHDSPDNQPFGAQGGAKGPGGNALPPGQGGGGRPPGGRKPSTTPRSRAPRAEAASAKPAKTTKRAAKKTAKKESSDD